jgi:hypothetical protein
LGQFGQNSPTFSKNAIGCHVFGRQPWPFRDSHGSKNVAPGFRGPLKLQFLFAFFFGAREDRPVLLRSRAICRLSRIFSEILQDRHRPPSDLADRLMRNSSIRAKCLIGQKNPYSRSTGKLNGRLRVQVWSKPADFFARYFFAYRY